MQKVKRFIQKLEDHRLLVAIIFTLAFIAIHVPLIFCHEPWSDETNPWAIAQKIDVTNAYELKFADPHSLAWEMILAPFAHLGMPEITMHFISLTIVALAVFLLMYKSPFHLATRILFSCSAIFFYFNPIVSRDYCLIPLAVTLVACTYRKRFKHPIKYLSSKLKPLLLPLLLLRLVSHRSCRWWLRLLWITRSCPILQPLSKANLS